MPGYPFLPWTSALHFAIVCQRTESVKVLVASGADVNRLDRWGNTPLLRAVKNEGAARRVRAEMARAILSATSQVVDVGARDRDGETAMDVVTGGTRKHREVAKMIRAYAETIESLQCLASLKIDT